jgi:hypothetical protein
MHECATIGTWAGTSAHHSIRLCLAQPESSTCYLALQEAGRYAVAPQQQAAMVSGSAAAGWMVGNP